MSPEEAPVQVDPIQLHFCQRCGISIPVSDVASGRAEAAPGGYVCGSCSTGRVFRDVAPAAAVSRRAEGGLRTLVALALIYVVGAASFLLYRELERKPPSLQLPAFASPDDVERLGRKVDGLAQQLRDTHDRGSAAALRQEEGLDALRRIAEDAERAALDREKGSLERDQNLLGALDAIGRRAGILKSDLDELLTQKLESLRKEIAAAKEKGAGGPPVATPPADTGNKPPKDPAEGETARQLREQVAKLQSKDTPERARYTAAVQLGELKDPGAVEPLMRALESDPNELVQRGAAWSLGRLGKHSVKAIPALIAKVGGKEEYVGYMCDRALGEITQDAMGARVTFNYDPSLPRKARQEIQKKWEEWSEKNRALLPGGEKKTG
jgi:hypothetical protein